MNRADDVIVVGGGVSGCAVAYELARRSVRVRLLDSGLPGTATSASAGGLWPIGEATGLGCGVIYHAAREPDDGKAAAPAALPDVFRDFLIASNERFPIVAEELLERTGINIEWSAGIGLVFLMYSPHEQAIVDGIARSLPADKVLEILTPDEVADVEPHVTRDMLGGALLPGEHQVNPMLLAEGYKRAAIAAGCAFRHNARVTGYRRRGDRVVGVELGDEFLPGAVTINAAGAWSGRLAATCSIDLPVYPVRGQVVLTESLPRVLNGCISTSACYLLQKEHGEILIGSTTERVGFDASVTLESIRSLCRGAIRAVPMLRDVGVKRTWSGLRPGTPDELPVLGPAEGVEGLVHATGGFRTGIVGAPLMAEVVAQMVVGESPSFPSEPFSASRFDAASTPALPG